MAPVSLVIIFFVTMMVLPDVFDIEIEIASPEVVNVNQAFEIQWLIRNDSANQQTLVDIDLADEYLQGIVIESSDPPFSASEHEAIGSYVSYSFDLPIPPEQTTEITFSALGKVPGDYSGVIGFCINSRLSCLEYELLTTVE